MKQCNFLEFCESSSSQTLVKIKELRYISLSFRSRTIAITTAVGGVLNLLGRMDLIPATQHALDTIAILLQCFVLLMSFVAGKAEDHQWGRHSLGNERSGLRKLCGASQDLPAKIQRGEATIFLPSSVFFRRLLY